MSYVEFDPIKPEVFENFVSKKQKRRRIITGIVLVGIALVAIYLINKNSLYEDEE